MRILLVEDELRIASFIERGLKEQHYIVDTVNNGIEGAMLAEINPYDMLVLDVVLPGKDGISVCRELREKNINVPILMLSGKCSVKDKVGGLDAGADDYLAKPFAFEEFLARVRALLRKNQQNKTGRLKIDDLELDQMKHKVKRADKEIALANKEYALLEYLMLNADKVVTRTMIAEHVWNEDFDTFSNIYDVYIHRLRSKIDKNSSTKLIHSIRGVGYILKSGENENKCNLN